MQNKLKLAFVIISFAATMLTLYAANQDASGQPTVGGVDVSRFSPQMLSISPRVAGGKATTIPLSQDTIAQRQDSLSTRNN
ncbi:MAG: hypothetical protein IT262_00750 [Saprospiraceae bacterium]|nr:hypothetical protein [Saprospiraceae bacterium]